MITVKRSDFSDPDFQKLIIELDKDLWLRYPDTQQNFAPFNSTNQHMRVVLAWQGNDVVGCGCFKPFPQDGAIEIKRMYVSPLWRGNKIGTFILQELEQWAHEEGYRVSKLETGIYQPEAIALYERSGYRRIPNFPPYQAIAESICFEKKIQ